MNNIDESGRSMVEMLGVLSIMGVIMYGAVAGINYGVDMYKINATYNQLEELGQGIADLYSWKHNQNAFSSVSNRVVCENDLVRCTGNSYSITSEWGQAITIGSYDGGTKFEITIPQVPYIACERLRTQIFRTITLDSSGACSDDAASNNLVFHGPAYND